ncbi:hypothetical protein EJV46_10575 [Roseococcus sp. SYP-B2431]|uniref:hypothetical protein n=1 Tax=Roseococcus sp. SYP-B2431 TaxID=2496640 RepID=UPI0010408F50|nr:hypothetical protein [Roseococcus sp. SYP-B2431]TCH98987.1 hypothetical protein EJV46_10575 [Roseococcus sp. SYP-B2431]
MIRVLSLTLALALGACGQLDTSPGASGVPDTPIGPMNFTRGQITTGGQVILDRELVPRR